MGYINGPAKVGLICPQIYVFVFMHMGMLKHKMCINRYHYIYCHKEHKVLSLEYVHHVETIKLRGQCQ